MQMLSKHVAKAGVFRHDKLRPCFRIDKQIVGSVSAATCDVLFLAAEQKGLFAVVKYENFVHARVTGEKTGHGTGHDSVEPGVSIKMPPQGVHRGGTEYGVSQTTGTQHQYPRRLNLVHGEPCPSSNNGPLAVVVLSKFLFNDVPSTRDLSDLAATFS